AAVSVFRALLDDGVTPVVLDDEIVGIRARESAMSGEASILRHCTVIHPSELGEWKNACELVIVLGGDGTILRAAERFHGSGVPLMGVTSGMWASSPKARGKTSPRRSTAPPNATTPSRSASPSTYPSGTRARTSSTPGR